MVGLWEVVFVLYFQIITHSVHNTQLIYNFGVFSQLKRISVHQLASDCLHLLTFYHEHEHLSKRRMTLNEGLASVADVKRFMKCILLRSIFLILRISHLIVQSPGRSQSWIATCQNGLENFGFPSE